MYSIKYVKIHVIRKVMFMGAGRGGQRGAKGAVVPPGNIQAP